MRTRRIGSREVSAIGLGAMPMSVREHNDPDQAFETIAAAVEEGITLIDTADAYSRDEAEFGHNEELVASVLRRLGATDDVLVATKGGHTRSGTDWGLDGSPEYLARACRESLRRLGVERIGLYQHHRPDPQVPYAETLGGLKALHDEGLVEMVGLSNADPAQIRAGPRGAGGRADRGAEPVLPGLPQLGGRDRPLRGPRAGLPRLEPPGRHGRRRGAGRAALGLRRGGASATR